MIRARPHPGLGVLLALWVTAAAAHGAAPPFRLLEPGAPAPAFSLKGLDGEPHEVGSGAAGPELLFFWSVYCPNCKEAMPGLVDLYRRWAPRGLRVWAINVDGERFSNAVRAYVRGMDLPFPVLYDRLEGDLLVAADPLGVTKTPTLYLLDPEGRVLLHQAVRLEYDVVEQALADLPAP